MTLNKAIEVWGERSQLIKLNEELGELISAVSKYLNKDVEKRHKEADLVKSIVNECADVEILIDQLKTILDIRDVVYFRKLEKLDRLETILNETK